MKMCVRLVDGNRHEIYSFFRLLYMRKSTAPSRPWDDRSDSTFLYHPFLNSHSNNEYPFLSMRSIFSLFIKTKQKSVKSSEKNGLHAIFCAKGLLWAIVTTYDNQNSIYINYANHSGWRRTPQEQTIHHCVQCFRLTSNKDVTPEVQAQAKSIKS